MFNLVKELTLNPKTQNLDFDLALKLTYNSEPLYLSLNPGPKIYNNKKSKPSFPFFS